MRVGFIGSGTMADALGTRWAHANHDLMVAGRTAGKAEALARKWNGRAGSVREVTGFADITVIAVLYQDIPATLAEIGDGLRGRPIVDCTNPVETGHFTLTTEPGRSLAQHIAQETGGHVVKAFNLCQARVFQLDPPVFDGRPLIVPTAGDDPAATDLTAQLIRDLGAEPLPVGDLRHAHYLEAMAALVISLLWHGRPWHTVFNLVDQR